MSLLTDTKRSFDDLMLDLTVPRSLSTVLILVVITSVADVDADDEPDVVAKADCTEEFAVAEEGFVMSDARGEAV